jgi:hypothetical protein
MPEAYARPIRQRWAFVLAFVFLAYLTGSGFSPVTYYRAHLLGARICQMAKDGAFEVAAPRFLIPDLQPTGPGLTAWLRHNGARLASSCHHLEIRYYQPHGRAYGHYIMYVCRISCDKWRDSHMWRNREREIPVLILYIGYQPLNDVIDCVIPGFECFFALQYMGYSASKY